VVLDKVATTIEARRPSIPSAQETVVAAGKSAAEGAKALAGEVANAAATAAATATTGVVLDKVATAIEVKKPSSRTKKKVAKRVAAKKRAAPKKKANTKKASRKAAKKKRI
jgi:adenylate kinase